jgi:thioesterase domain-containing protein
MLVTASSVLLQGNVPTSVSNLFLFPGTFNGFPVFAALPPIELNRITVFELTCSFAHTPEHLSSISIPELARLYLAEIQRRQPHGPYSLLGYSVGGVIAYEAARQLLEAGEAVERIYLVDAPCPTSYRSTPHSLTHVIDSKQDKQREAEQQSKMSMKLMSALHATQKLLSLETYMPPSISSFPGHPIPKTTYFFAKQRLDSHNILKRPQISESDTGSMSWFREEREGFGVTGDGWERLVDRSKLKIVPLNGNHLSIMEEPNVSCGYFFLFPIVLVTDFIPCNRSQNGQPKYDLRIGIQRFHLKQEVPGEEC